MSTTTDTPQPEPSLTTLLTSLRSTLAPTTHPFGPSAYYLIPATIIAQSPFPHRLAELYTHLVRHEHLDPKALSTKLRDMLMKQVPLVGAPQVLSALIPLAAADAGPAYGKEGAGEAARAAVAAAAGGKGGEGKDEGRSAMWKDLDADKLHARGTATIDTIYGGELLPKIFESFGGHTLDTAYMELLAVYGVYLSEFSVLGPIETELVVWTTINCTGLRGPALWHLRGMGRLLGARGRGEGEGDEKVRWIKDRLREGKVAMMESVEWVGEEMVRRSGLDGGVDGRGWCNVGDVVRELGGWGDDPFEEAK